MDPNERLTATVSPFETEDSGSASYDHHCATFANPRHGRSTVFGWITSDHVVIFTEDTPKFCPETGKALIPVFPGESSCGDGC